MAATMMASKTLILRNPNPHHHLRLSPNPSFPASLRPLNLRPFPKSRRAIASHSLQSPAIKPVSDDVQSTIADSTKTISSILAAAASLSSLTLTTIHNWSSKIKSLYIIPTPEEIASLQSLQDNVVCSLSPLFFAAIRSRPSGALNTPLTVVAAGLSKWLDIYSGVLLVRVLLSWFPNIPWDRQPLSAIRDLCDPYLNLFRNIIPPIFDTLDVSPLLAFAVLGVLGSILRNSRGV